MAQQLTLGIINTTELETQPLDWGKVIQSERPFRPAAMQWHSDPIPRKISRPGSINAMDDHSSGESRDIVDDATLPTLPRQSQCQPHERRQSYSTLEDSPTPSRSSSPRPSLPSSTTTPSLYTVDSFTGFHATSVRRPSVLTRLRSSISTASSTNDGRKPVLPEDFQIPPEQPEKRFIDAIGMVIPGVCDRNRCTHLRAHFVSTFRLCEPIEYTTTLADHGITYTDYSRLVTALSNFLDEITSESKQKKNKKRRSDAGLVDGDVEDVRRGSREVGESASPMPQKSAFFDTTEQLDKAKYQASSLSKLLEDITWNLQARGVPVMISVNSFSLFAPHRISEAHIQILHVTLEQLVQAEYTTDGPSETTTRHPSMEEQLSFIDLSLLVPEERTHRPKLERQPVSAATTMTTRMKGSRPQHQHQQAQLRDRSKPSALWPNAIPSRKRPVMSANAERYGLDPYFRAWMRANINARTRSNTYAKYMIEQEDDPFVNKRLDYSEPASRGTLVLDVMAKGTQAWKEQFPSAVNRAKYEHNRRLECRRTVEHGSRLRILRFGFRHAIYPPHTPEMSALGLTREAYQTIISNIDTIHTQSQLNTKRPMSYLMASLNKIRKRSTEDTLMKVSEYIRELNGPQRRIVWTIEKIPGVYDRGLARDRTEWEISAWNGEDPLELVLQLEKWGIIEKRLDVDDEDSA
ncbi:Nn.00g093710.m01.CDS01 [Neocucurbitaria sp. VM-36]